MQKENNNIAVNYRHSAIGELLWILPIIRSIALHNKKKVILFTRKETSAKLLLEKEDYLSEIIYLPFRKGLHQLTDILKQAIIFKKKKIKKLYVLEEIVRPLISGKIAGINEMYAFGKKKQKKYLSQQKFLNELDDLSHDAHQIKLFKDKYFGRKGLIADLFSFLKEVCCSRICSRLFATYNFSCCVVKRPALNK